MLSLPSVTPVLFETVLFVSIQLTCSNQSCFRHFCFFSILTMCSYHGHSSICNSLHCFPVNLFLSPVIIFMWISFVKYKNLVNCFITLLFTFCITLSKSVVMYITTILFKLILVINHPVPEVNYNQYVVWCWENWTSIKVIPVHA